MFSACPYTKNMEQGLPLPAGPEGYSQCGASCVGSSILALPH